MKIIKSYEELIKFPSFKERFEYLKLSGFVGGITFGGNRFLNQRLYQSDDWKKIRQEVILRDQGCDLGILERPISGKVYIHHIVPITIDDILQRRFCVFDLNNLICTSFQTHNAVHYGSDKKLLNEYTERKQNDTCPWR